MRYLGNIDVAKLSKGIIDDISQFYPTFAGVNNFYYHYLTDPAKINKDIDYFIRADYEVIADNPEIMMLSKSAVYENEGKEIPCEEYVVIYKRLGIVFYTDWEEQHYADPHRIGIEVQAYLEGDNQYNGWLP